MHDPSRAAFDRLVSWLAPRIDAVGIPGTSIGVVHGDDSWTWAEGTTRIDGGTAVTPATPFPIASLTKVFTASAVARLAGDGSMETGAKVRDYVPDFAIADEAASAAITVNHLLSHSAGWEDVVEPDPAHHDLGWYLGPLATVPSLSPPGRRFSYSNSAFMVLGHLIETVTGETYEAFVRQSILDPAGMRDVGFTFDGDRWPDRAHGHVPGESGVRVIEPEPIPRAINPAAGLVGSVDGMLPFLRMVLQDLVRDDSAFDAMLHPQVAGGAIGPTAVDAIGQGWMSKTIGNRHVILSLGSDAGSCAGMAIVPDASLGIVMLANSETALATIYGAIEQVVAEFLGERNASPAAVSLDPRRRARLTGSFAMNDAVTVSVVEQDDRLAITTSAGGEAVPQFSGVLTMVDELQGYMIAMGGEFWVDLVPGDSGSIDWMRFAARLAPRVA